MSKAENVCAGKPVQGRRIFYLARQELIVDLDQNEKNET
jgi:hypothetical protein